MVELEHVPAESEDLVAERVEQMKALFPEIITEGEGTVDFEKLRLILGDEVEEGDERYAFIWPGKADAIRQSQTVSTATLRPRRDESVDWDTTQNLYIEGDNLEVLKLLLRGYHGKVKLIYIDPPYNTNSDFVYADSFDDPIENYKKQCGISNQSNANTYGRHHSQWCTFMYARLTLARNLLAEDGIILINIDENEYTNLQNLMHEVFGEDNDLGTIVWDKRNPKGDATGISTQHEYIVVYARIKDAIADKHVLQRPKKNAQAMIDKAHELFSKISLMYTLEDANKEFKAWVRTRSELSGGEKAYNSIDDEGRLYQPVSMAWPNKKKAPDDYFVPLIHPVTGKPCPVPPRGWRNPSSTMQDLLSRGLILFGPDETTQPRRKYLLEENMMENIPSLLYNGSSDTAMLEKMGIPFDTPKVTSICTEHIQALTSDEDIVLDFFSGSATTAHAVMAANAADGGNRRYIHVQLPEPCSPGSQAATMGFETICDIGKKRIREAGKLYPGVDTGFRVLALDESGIAKPEDGQLLIDRIKPDRSDLDIIFEMMLKWGLELTYPIEEDVVEGYPIYSIAYDELICCMHDGLNTDVLEAIAARQPRRVFLLDSVIDDTIKLNALQIFKRVEDRTQQKIDLRTV